MDLKLKKLKLRSIRFPIPEKPDKGKETEVTLLEAESEKLLNCADMTAQEMQEFYPQLLHPADPDQMDKAVEGKVNSLRRATFNLAKTYLKTYEISDELGARWKDAKPARRKRKRRLISPAPANALIDQEEDESDHFTKGLNIYKLLWVFYIGSFAGVIIELLWCFINEGYFESRNGLIYGSLNPLYGAGAAALSLSCFTSSATAAAGCRCWAAWSWAARWNMLSPGCRNCSGAPARGIPATCPSTSTAAFVCCIRFSGDCWASSGSKSSIPSAPNGF